MSQQKQNVLSVGPGGMTQYQAQTANIISSNITCKAWSSTTTYGDLNVVEYSGALYRSVNAGNIGNQPDAAGWSAITTYSIGDLASYQGVLYASLVGSNLNNIPISSPSEWSALVSYWSKELSAVKDGDICVVVNGNKSDTQQRSGGLWRSLANQPIRTALVDGQLTPAVAFQFSATSFPYATIDFTIRRGSGHGRKKRGRLVIMNDGTGSMTYSLEYEELGIDVQVTMIPVLIAGQVQMQYTSVDNGGVAIELAYDLKGWV